MRNIAVIFIGTGPYIGFFDGFYRRVQRFFCVGEQKKVYVFTDQIENPTLNRPNVSVQEIEHVGWPFITLHRFKYMNSIRESLKNHSHVFFIDADLWPIDEISFDELFEDNESYDFIAVQHPGFIEKRGTFEDNPNSKAYAYGGSFDLSVYRQGCFWGGKTNSILEMISVLDANVDEDQSNDITAKWHDESHMNRFFLENSSRVKTLGAGYATPEAPGYEHVWGTHDIKMVHLNKDPESFPRFEGAKK